VPDREVQDEVYYFPVIDENKGVILFVIGIIGLMNGYTYEIKVDTVEALNKADYLSSNPIVYLHGNSIYVEDEKGVIYGMETCDAKKYIPSLKEAAFAKLTYKDKLSKIINRAKKFEKFIPPVWKSEEERLNAVMKGSITLRIPMVQYGYGMCWASTAATIINNLRLSGTITPFDVCNNLGIGYDSGGNVYDVQSALYNYGISYMVRSRNLTWSELTTNINNSKPIAAGAVNRDYSHLPLHMVTIYGYTGTSTTTNNVFIWDSAASSGNGGYYSFSYSGFAFTSNGTVYIWDRTVSQS
jgi:hypothetical protein